MIHGSEETKKSLINNMKRHCRDIALEAAALRVIEGMPEADVISLIEDSVNEYIPKYKDMSDIEIMMEMFKATIDVTRETESEKTEETEVEVHVIKL